MGGNSHSPLIKRARVWYNTYMGYGFGSMMGGGGLFGVLGLLTWLVYLTVGVLLIIYLSKKINKK